MMKSLNCYTFFTYRKWREIPIINVLIEDDVGKKVLKVRGSYIPIYL
jgi:hypothetical protein